MSMRISRAKLQAVHKLLFVLVNEQDFGFDAASKLSRPIVLQLFLCFFLSILQCVAIGTGEGQ